MKAGPVAQERALPTLVGQSNLAASPQWVAFELGNDPALDVTWVADDPESPRLVVPTYVATGPQTVGRGDLRPLLGDRSSSSWWPMLVCGLPHSRDNSLADDQGVIPLRALAEVTEAVAQVAAGNGCKSTVWPFYDRSSARALSQCMSAAHLRRFHTAVATIDVSADTYEAYLAGLGRRERHNRRHEERVLRDAGCEVVHDSLAEHYEAVAQLAAFTQRKHGRRGDVALLREYIQRQNESLDRRIQVFLVVRNGEVLAASTCLAYQKVLYVLRLGMSYDELDGLPVYPVCMVTRPMRLAIETGCRTLHLGTESYRAKVLRGAHLNALELILSGGEPDAYAAIRADGLAAAASIDAELPPKLRLTRGLNYPGTDA